MKKKGLRSIFCLTHTRNMFTYYVVTVSNNYYRFYKNKSDEEEEGSEVELASDDETLGLKEDFEPMKKMSKSQLKKQNKQHPLITDLEQGDPDARKKRKAEAWFEQVCHLYQSTNDSQNES